MRRVSVHRGSVGVFVTDTHVSEAHKGLSNGAAAAPLPSLPAEASGQERAGRGGTCPGGEQGARDPCQPGLTWCRAVSPSSLHKSGLTLFFRK